MSGYNDRLVKWAAGPDGNELIETSRLLQYLGENLFNDYEPCYGPHSDYSVRLEKWLDNVKDELDQQNLLRLAKRIFYVGREEFNSLYRAAFKTNYTRWIIDQENIDILSSDAYQRIHEAQKHTWFCPVTDSLRINQFYHINGVDVSHEFRPDWRSLKKFGDETKIKDYIQANNVKYIVLIEDFVGSATQSHRPVKFASDLDPNLKILFLPLLICPLGVQTITNKINGASNFTMSPVLIINNHGFIPPMVANQEEPSFPIFRTIIEKNEPEQNGMKYGYKNMGCLLVMHTNVPNNSLPLIYYESDKGWNPLFRRHHRSS